MRVIRSRPDFDILLDEAVGQPRRYGDADPAVLSRIMGLLREVAWSTRTRDQQHSVRRQLQRLRSAVAATDFDEAELAGLDRDSHLVEAALEKRWPFNT